MVEPIRVKIVCKPLTNTKYHLATFNQAINSKIDISKHILEEAVRVSFDKTISNLNSLNLGGVDSNKYFS